MLCALLLSSTVSAAVDWVFIGNDNDLSLDYVDSNSIRRDNNRRGVFHAFIKNVYTDAGREYWLKEFAQQGLDTGELQSVASVTYLQYYKLADGLKYYATSNIVFHDADGLALKRLSNDRLKWTIITPDTIEELLFDFIAARLPN